MSTKNAAAKNLNEVKTLPQIAATEQTTNDAKPAVMEQKAENAKPVIAMTAEARIKKAEQFQILSGKFEGLKQKGEQLEKFIISNDSTKTKITLSNSMGFTFEVTNSNTISRVLAVIKEDVGFLLEKAENQILDFAI